MDQIEQSLKEISDKLSAAWKNNRCLECPLAELSALAAAALIFYRENKKHNGNMSEGWGGGSK